MKQLYQKQFIISQALHRFKLNSSIVNKAMEQHGKHNMIYGFVESL